MSDTRSSRPVTPQRSPEEEGPAHTGARWPLPEEDFWSEANDPHVVDPGDRTAPQPAIRPQTEPQPQPGRPQAADQPQPAAQPQAARSQATQPQSAQSQAPQSQAAQSQSGRPQAGQSQAVRSEAAQSQAAVRSRSAAQPQQAVRAQAAARAPESGKGREERAEPQPQAEAPKRKRDPFLDNVKFLLIATVPIGHSLVPTLAADSSRAAYIFIYTFHMPLFVLISGYLSRNFWNSNAKTNKLVDTLLIPYVAVEVGYAILRFALGQKWSLTITDPAWLNWYMLALLFWRLSTPVWKRMKYPLPVAVVIFLVAGFSQISGNFSLDRFFGLLPYFVLGLVMQPEHFQMLNRTWIKILAVLTVIGAAGVAIFIAPDSPLGPFYNNHSYEDLHLSWYMGLVTRSGLLVCGLAMCFAILALVPRRETWFTDLGTRTLYCYLLHGIPVLIAKDQGWLKLPWLHGPLGVLAIASTCFALAIVLCLPITRTVFKWALEPRLTWLYRRPSRS